jgi:hypothetical protein
VNACGTWRAGRAIGWLGLLVGLGMVCATTLVSAAPAQAANRCSHMAHDPSYACVDPGNAAWINVCDRDHDGHKTYARVHTQFLQEPFFPSGYDDSYLPPCHREGYNGNIDWFQVCVQYEGCGSRVCTFSGSVWCQSPRRSRQVAGTAEGGRYSSGR